MKFLVGDTGLIGSVLQQSANFDATFNSRNIHELTEIATMPGQQYSLLCRCFDESLGDKSDSYFHY